MTDLSRMDLEEIRNRLYDLAVLMRRDGKSSFAAAELDEKFKLHYGSHVPVAKFGFSYLSELLDGSRWFSRAGTDSSRFACVKRENYQFAYKIPKNSKQGKIDINLEPEAWLQHIKKEIKQELDEIPPPASPDPSPSPPASPSREVAEVIHDVLMPVDGQRPNASQGAVSVPKRKRRKKWSPRPMRKLDAVTEILFKKLYDDQIAATPHLLGPVPPGLNLNFQVENFVDTVGGILKKLGGRARFDEVEMEFRKQEGDSFAEMCAKYLSSDMGPFNVLRLMSSGKIEVEIRGPRIVYFCLKHPIDLVIDGVLEYLRSHGGKGELSAVNAWFKEHYVTDLSTRCKDLFGGGFLTMFREFVILSKKFFMQFVKDQCHFCLFGGDPTCAVSSTLSVVDVLLDRILVCLLFFGRKTSFGALAWYYEEEIYMQPFHQLVFHAFGSYQKLASVAKLKKKFTLNLDNATWVFKLIEDVDSTTMDVEETTSVIRESPSDAIPQPASSPKPILGTKLPSLMELDCSNATGLVSTKSMSPLSLRNTNIPPLFPREVAAGDVDMGPIRFPRFKSSSIAKPSLPPPNPPQSSSAHDESTTETILAYFNPKFFPLPYGYRIIHFKDTALDDVDIGPSRLDYDSFSKKLLANRLISYLHRAPDYRLTVWELNALYKKTYAKELDLDLMAAFGTIDLHEIKCHNEMRGKIDIWESKSKGWMYRLERSQRPESSRSRDRHRRVSPIVGRDSRKRSHRSSGSSKSRRSSPHHRNSRSRSRRSREKSLRSKRSSSPRKSRRSRSRHTTSSSDKHDHRPRRCKTLTPSRSLSRHRSRSKEKRCRSRMRDSSADSSPTPRAYRKHNDRHRRPSSSSRDPPLFQKTKKNENAVALGSELEVGSSEGMKKQKMN